MPVRARALRRPSRNSLIRSPNYTCTLYQHKLRPSLPAHCLQHRSCSHSHRKGLQHRLIPPLGPVVKPPQSQQMTMEWLQLVRQRQCRLHRHL